MSVPLWCSRSKVFDEFSESQIQEWFDLEQKKVLFNYDNLYYSVFLEEERSAAQISYLIADLLNMKSNYDFKADPPEFRSTRYTFEYFPRGVKFHNNTLSVKECFDILLCETLPNDVTPRIVVQIRSRYLWTKGVVEAFNASLDALTNLMSYYDITIKRTQANRIDYAFHSNLIQNIEDFYDRTKLVNTCKTPARMYAHYGDPQRNWSIDTLSIGSRKSGSVFFRSYNKSREVVEMAYKAFFIEKWKENGLINNYDKYCLESAYAKKSFDVGLLIARIDWYLEFGQCDETKSVISAIKDKYYAQNSNSTKIRKKLDNIVVDNSDRRAVDSLLPKVTTIVNIEYETHRCFYDSFVNSIDNVIPVSQYDPLRTDVMRIYDCRASFIDYLTCYDGSVSFVKDIEFIKSEIPRIRNRYVKYVNGQRKYDKAGFDKAREEFIETQYKDFWKRVRRADVGECSNYDLYRTYERNVDIERQKRRVAQVISNLSVLKRGENVQQFDGDFSLYVALINDNDMDNVIYKPVDILTGESPEIKYGDYNTIKGRSNRQYRTLVQNQTAQDDQNDVSTD